jgi:hypothetical protein
MEFKTEAQKSVYEKVAPMVREIFGEFAQERDDIPQFGVLMGSSITRITVIPWGDDDATISITSYVVSGAEITPELMEYLLRENASMRFGAFGIDSDDDIQFEHTIVGSTCDKEELKASAMAVVRVSDKYDDEIVARFGGQRATDQK